jgi:hypothetical protein
MFHPRVRASMVHGMPDCDVAVVVFNVERKYE